MCLNDCCSSLIQPPWVGVLGFAEICLKLKSSSRTYLVVPAVLYTLGDAAPPTPLLPGRVPPPPSSRAEARTGLGVSCVRVDYTRAQTVHEYAAVQAIQYTRAILQQLQLLCDIVYLNFFLPYCEPVLLL